jgi:hypothetical protein
MDSNLKAGQSWTKEIERAIDRADVVTVILTIASFKSETVRAELLRARRKGKRIVPVMVAEGTDVPLVVEPLQRVVLGRVAEEVECR